MDKSYQIVADVTADIDINLFQPGEVEFIPMSLTLGDNFITHYSDFREISPSNFYIRLKNGEASKTTQINISDYILYFERYLKKGIDVLYFCFSSGLSGTFQSAKIAAYSLSEKYPERRIIVIDTLCASIGLGLLVYTAALKKRDGSSLDEIISWVEENKMRICHLFSVDDLRHLHRGGRLSAASAVAGSMLRIKPILSLDDNGKLFILNKVRGSMRSLEILSEQMLELGTDLNSQNILIGHANAPDNAYALADIIKKTCSVKNIIFSNIGPVIGSHVGHGMTALTFLGKHRAHHVY